MQAGIHVKDIGPALSPMAYFSQFHLGCTCGRDGHGQPQPKRLDRCEDGL